MEDLESKKNQPAPLTEEEKACLSPEELSMYESGEILSYGPTDEEIKNARYIMTATHYEVLLLTVNKYDRNKETESALETLPEPDKKKINNLYRKKEKLEDLLRSANRESFEEYKNQFDRIFFRFSPCDLSPVEMDTLKKEMAGLVSEGDNSNLIIVDEYKNAEVKINLQGYLFIIGVTKGDPIKTKKAYNESIKDLKAKRPFELIMLERKAQKDYIKWYHEKKEQITQIKEEIKRLTEEGITLLKSRPTSTALYYNHRSLTKAVTKNKNTVEGILDNNGKIISYGQEIAKGKGKTKTLNIEEYKLTTDHNFLLKYAGGITQYLTPTEILIYIYLQSEIANQLYIPEKFRGQCKTDGEVLINLEEACKDFGYNGKTRKELISQRIRSTVFKLYCITFSKNEYKIQKNGEKKFIRGKDINIISELTEVNLPKNYAKFSVSKAFKNFLSREGHRTEVNKNIFKIDTLKNPNAPFYAIYISEGLRSGQNGFTVEGIIESSPTGGFELSKDNRNYKDRIIKPFIRNLNAVEGIEWEFSYQNKIIDKDKIPFEIFKKANVKINNLSLYSYSETKNNPKTNAEFKDNLTEISQEPEGIKQ